jgi:hypothetical protein
MLSSSPESDRGRLSYNHKRLRQVISRRFGYSGIQFAQVRTSEGFGVLHILWAWQGSRSFYIPQEWLSGEWQRIHRAPVVWVSRVGSGKWDRHRVGKYMVTQYCANQRGFEHLSYSWWSLPFSLARGWETVKALASVCFWDDERFRWRREYVLPMSQVISAWEHLLDSGSCILGEMLLEVQGRNVVEVF